MLLSLIALVAVVAGWSLAAKRFDRWTITAPIVFVAAGIAVGLSTHSELAAALDSEEAQLGAELILAVLLFVDATEVRGGFFGYDARSAARVLLVAMPISLGLSVFLGLWLLPGLAWPVLLVIACVVVPTDFAPSAATLRDPRIPERVRHLLNVEGGYNDGIISPIFVFALVLAGDHSHANTPAEALTTAVPQALVAIVIGGAVGSVLSILTNVAESHDFMTEQSKRVILVAAPLLAYGASFAAHGNGFVAAFVAGVAYTQLRRSSHFHRELELLDDMSFLLTLGMWFIFGSVTVVALERGITWGLVVFCLLALTVVRMLPILASLLGSRFPWRDRLMIGWLGPRGTSAIVLGLLAFNVLSGSDESAALLTMVIAVLCSVVLHGFGSPAAARAYARKSVDQASPLKEAHVREVDLRGGVADRRDEP